MTSLLDRGRSPGAFAIGRGRRDNSNVQINLRNLQRERLFQVTVDTQSPPAVVHAPDRGGAEVRLSWEQALDDQGHLRHCPACGCRELFIRRDFPQKLGMAIVVLAGLASVVLFAIHELWWALGVLGAVVVVDLLIFVFTSLCVVCYRCRTEFRGLPIGKDQPGWDLATGEKYRMNPEQATAATPGHQRSSQP